MKFLILASLFVLSVVAEPEAEPQHHTAGFVAYTNGAITPDDTDSVKAAKIQHHTLKAALIGGKKAVAYAAVNPFHQVYQPQVYGPHLQQQFVAPRVCGVECQAFGQRAFAPRVYGIHHQQQFVAPQVYGVHGVHQQVYQPRGVFGMPAFRHLGKREAEAEPEAEAEAEAQYYGSQYYGQYYGTPASTYPLARYPYASAYTTGYPTTYNTAYTTGYPTTYNTALTGYPTTYNTALAGYPTTYNTVLTGYPTTYNTALTGYPSVYNTAYTGYPTTAYTGYPTTYNTAFTGYPSVYKAALYNKAVQKDTVHRQ